ncbi:hypothetical protein GC177_10970 [bacterium]|nr:hypothetical protein [bacterium]
MRRTRQWLIYGMAGMAGAVFGVLLWLFASPSPQQVGWVLRIVHVLNGSFDSNLTSQQAVFTRNGWSGEYRLDVDGLKIEDRQHSWVIKAPRLTLEISLPGLMNGRPVTSLRSPYIRTAIISRVGVVTSKTQQAKSQSWDIVRMANHFFTSTHVPEVYLEKIDITYRQPAQDIHWEMVGASITTAPDANGGMSGKLDAGFTYQLPVLEVMTADEKTGELTVKPVTAANARPKDLYGPFVPDEGDKPLVTSGEAQLHVDAQWPGVGSGVGSGASAKTARQQGKAHMEARNIPLAIAALLDSQLAPVAGLRGTVNATLDAVLNPWGGLTSANLTLTSEHGAYVQHEWYDQPVDYRDFQAHVTMGGKPGVWLLKDASVKTMQATASAEGMLDVSGPRPVFDVTTRVENFPASALGGYWPKTAGADPREWVLTHITEGTVSKAVGRFRMSAADYAAKRTFGQTLFAQLELENATIGYYDDMTPVTGVNGFVQFTGRGLKARLAEGRIGEAKVTDAALDMEDFLIPITNLHLRAHVEGPASAVASYLSHPVLEVSQLVGLDAAHAGGRVSGEYTMHLEIGTAGKVTMHYGVDADLHDVSNPNLLDRYDVSAANGKLKIVNDRLTLQGSARLNDVPAKLNVSYAIGSADEAVDYTAEVDTDGAGLTRLGFGVPNGPMGTLGGTSQIKVEANVRKGREITKVQADLKNATLDVPVLGYSKPAGKPASASLTATYDDTTKITGIPDLKLTGEGLNLQGSIVVDGSNGDGGWREVKLPVLRMGKSDVQLEMTRKGGVVNVKLRGDVLDASSLLDQSDELMDDGAKNSSPMEVDASVSRMLFGDKRELKNVSFTMSCNADLCSKAEGKGSFGSGEIVTYKLEKNAEGKRSVSMGTENAGEFFRVLDISDNVMGGKLDLKGYYDDTKPGHPLVGRLNVTKFKTSRANALAKLLNVASLTGITELLEGGGIGFEKLHAPFVFGHGILEVKDAYSIGPSLGITFTGKVDTKQEIIDADGAVIPSYMVNGILGSIPILGKLLTGGDSKGGLFAVNYSMKGSLKDPDVTVNPLSILTPGFLRKIFDIPAAMADSASGAPQIGDAIEKDSKPAAGKPMGSPNRK